MSYAPVEKGAAKPPRSDLRLKIIHPVRPASAPLTGNHVGQVCHNHILAELYIDLDEEGHVAAIHTVEVGSC